MTMSGLFVITTLLLISLSVSEARVVFNKPPSGGETVTVPENIVPGSALYNLQYTDDTGSPSHFAIERSSCDLNPAPASLPTFTINGLDQLVIPANGLDAENCPQFTFIFRVTSGGVTATSGPVTVLVTDVNDNAPIFSKTSYSGLLWKDTDVGLGQAVNNGDLISAIDPDISKVPITLSIAGAQTTFGINSSGLVFVNDPTGLAVLASPTILTIQASDGGLTSTVPFIIYFNDQPQSCQCEHGGSCLSLGIGHLCVYVPDPSSATCTFHYDPCKAAPCQNNGTCTPNKGTYSCSCLGSYAGKHCESVNYCDHNNCRNGSTCINLPHSYLCSCRPGYVGEHCTVVDYCHQTHCQHGGTCVNLPNGYMCNYLSTTHEANTTFHLSPVG